MRAFLFFFFFWGNSEWHQFTPGMGRATGEREKCANANIGLTWLLKSLNVKKDESGLVIGKDSYNFLIKKKQQQKTHIFFQLNIGWHTSASWVTWLLCLYAECALYFTLTNRSLAHAHSESV